jgi:hypothetical protein
MQRLPRLLSLCNILIVISLLSPALIFAQAIVTNDPPAYGPFNGITLPDGDGIAKPMAEHDSVLRADLPWTFYAWVRPSEMVTEFSLIAGVGDPTEEYPRYIASDGARLLLWIGRDNELAAPLSLTPGHWHFVAASFDGREFRLFCDGMELAHSALALGTVSPMMQMAPAMTPFGPGQSARVAWKHFGGGIGDFTLVRRAMAADELHRLAQAPPVFEDFIFEDGSKSWPVQTRGQAGYRAPQDATTMPVSKAAPSKAIERPITTKPSITSIGDGLWELSGGWQMIEAPSLKADGPAISTASLNPKGWMAATVPGTVLTTMIDRGRYPDPDYGLNNLAIPESLNKQDYWYRVEFKAPDAVKGLHTTLTFEGINYRAAIWLNGKSLGNIVGAFRRGIFDVTDVLKPGSNNVLAVRVSPPPHPGIPHEQSIKGGPGENGGIMCLDGPTFVATEGWDWIPAIRDRNTGIWQPVRLSASGGVRIGDPQVVTKLPLPDTSSAEVEVTVPVENRLTTAVKTTIHAAFAEITVDKQVTLEPGANTVKLTTQEFPQLNVKHPRLWWPNGYGKQELYDLKLTVDENGKRSDSKHVRFGIREITYELSLLDHAGHLRRVEYSPTTARAKNEHAVDVTHNGMRELPAFDPFPPNLPAEWRAGWKNWVASTGSDENSSALKAVSDARAAPYLVIKVNGVRIACRGGNWGMDDSRKRVSREKLEPYFRLDHDAHLNIIRNWVGQDTEETFYDLADEYGMLIWNDFWATTQNYNIEPQDPQLFLDNARDTILRFRNHPSIAVWCGRNEGVPQPILNEGLDDLISQLDGTRYYSPSSNQVNLANSGPYKYQDPTHYFTTLNHGFSVETGTPSMSTLESFSAWVPKEDLWPINDTWAYHDWHASGNGDTAPFMAEIQAEFGAPTSFEDFERKAQMLNYVDHRAIFEGMNAHLWSPNSARLLWMTQPAWPSTMWQILSADYDTQASYYGVKKANEPVHVQLDPSSYAVQVVNNTTTPLANVSVAASAFSVANKELLHQQLGKDVAAANEVTEISKLDIAPLLVNGVVLLKLELHDAGGQLLSDNFYWLGAESQSMRELARMPEATLTVSATGTRKRGARSVRLHVENRGTVAAIENKLTLLNAVDGTRILPAYYADNYFSLLPGEARDIEIEFGEGKETPSIAIRGWNLTKQTVSVK